MVFPEAKKYLFFGYFRVTINLLKMRVALVGATGMVGRVLRKIFNNYTVKKLLSVASKKSFGFGEEISFQDTHCRILSLEEAISLNPYLSLFSAGCEISKKWALRFVEYGSFVIDNSSAWRMDPNKPLLITEINTGDISEKDKVIANPNCSTIQFVMILATLHKRYIARRIVISTYQAVTGTGKKSRNQLEKESRGKFVEKIYTHQIYKNVLPYCDLLKEGGYTKEEIKLIRETKKILKEDRISITATNARLPITGGHSECVTISFKKKIYLDEIRNIFSNTPGIIVQDCPENCYYPMPILSKGKDEVFVGRIRRETSNSLNLWIVADNLLKGAANNAIQISEYLFNNQFL